MDLRGLTYSYYYKSKNRLPLPALWRTSYRVVELGAGLDNYAELFGRDNYLAVDIAPVRQGSGRAVQADLRGPLPLADGSFDAFIAANIMEHLPDPLAALKEAHRVCRRGGMVAVPVLDSFPFIYDPVNWVRKKKGLPLANFGIGGFGHLHVLCRKDWIALFERAGFSVEKQTDICFDLFVCAEYFLCSLFIARKEYQAVISSNESFMNEWKTFERVLNYFAKLLAKVHTILYRLNPVLRKHPVCVCFYLKRDDSPSGAAGK